MGQSDSYVSESDFVSVSGADYHENEELQSYFDFCRSYPYDLDYGKLNIHPKEATFIYSKFLGVSGKKLLLSEQDLLKALPTLKPVLGIIYPSLADKAKKKIKLRTFLSYCVISTRGSDEEKLELTCKLLCQRSDKIQLSTVLSFLKGIFTIIKPSKEKKKEIIQIVNEIFTKSDIVEEDPDDEIIPFDAHIAEFKTKHISAPTLSEDKFKEFQRRGKGKELKRTSYHQEKTLFEKVIEVKEDFKEEIKELKDEIKDLAKENLKELGAELKLKMKKKEKKKGLFASSTEDGEIEILDVEKKPEHKDTPHEKKELNKGNKEVNELKEDIEVKEEIKIEPDIEKKEEIKEEKIEVIEIIEEEKKELKETINGETEIIKDEKKENGILENTNEGKTEVKNVNEILKGIKDVIKEIKIEKDEKKEDLKDKIHEDDYEIDLDDFEEVDGEGKKKNWKDWLLEKLNTTRGIQDLSRKDFYKKTKKIKEFIDCFGLFQITSKIMDGVKKIKLFDMKNVVHRYGKPLLSGYIKGTMEGYAVIQFGYLMVYFGKKSEKEIQGVSPSVVLNLREAIVVDKKFKMHRLNVNLSKLKALGEEEEEEEYFTLTVNRIHYKIEVEDSVEKWVWALRMNSGVIQNPHHSFAPIRKHNGCEFLHCGQQYFDELAKCLKKAKNEIFICGWMFSPQYYLNRNPNKDRIDEILLQKAKDGVKIYLLLWKDPGFILDNGSLEAEQYYNGLKHENIFVIRDPSSFGLVIWSHHQKTVVIDQEIAFCGGIDIAYNRYEIPGVYPLYDTKEENFIGLDYVNPLIRQKNKGDYKENNYDRSLEPRMPWNDIHVKVSGIISLDLALNFIERWNYAAQEKQDMKNKVWLCPNLSNFHKRYDEQFSNCKVQVLRSISSWGFGSQLIESSIEHAYISLIEKAKHFIYIENQFFISAANKNQKYPENQVLASLLLKLRNAIKKKEKFRVVVMVPIQTASIITQLIMYWQYQTIYRGENSLFGILEKEFPKVDINDYITFSSMRHWDFCPKSPQNLVTEQVYVHSKCMIVDDKYAIIGSANINDRSLAKGRDSEICVLIEDVEKIEIKMGGEKFYARKFAHYLRVNLWKKYLGFNTIEEISDPVSFFSTWTTIAQKNTDIYIKVFQKIHDTIKNPNDLHYLAEYNQILKSKDIQEIEKITGFIVNFPKDFLCEAPKPKPIIQKESTENLYYM